MNSRTPQSINFDSVADLYDNYVRTDFDIPFWLEESKSVNGRVLELACGTGRVSVPLLKAGIDLSCVDYAPEMLARFRHKLEENHLSCRVYCQDIAELGIPDLFDLIIFPFHSFSEIADKQRQRLALTQIHSHMAEQARFICALQNPRVRSPSMDGTMRLIGEFPLPEGGTLVVRTRLTFDPSTQIANGEQVYERLSSEKVLLEQRSLTINFYLFNKMEFELLVRECGFSIEALYGDYVRQPFEEESSPFMIWKLKRTTTVPSI